VAGLGSGRYDVTQIVPFMGGIWTMTVSVQGDAGVDASTVFTFCIPD
jgi:hypothetical protein